MKTLCCEYLEPLLGCWQPSGLHTRSGYFSGLCDSWLQRTAFPCSVCFNQSPTGMWPLEWHNPFPETRFLFQEQLWSGNIPRCFLGKMVEVRSPAMLWWQKQIQVFCGIIKTYRWHGYGWLFLEIHSCTCCTEVGFSTVVVEIKSHVCLIRSPTPQPPKLRWRNILFHGNCTSCGCQCLTSCLRLKASQTSEEGLFHIGGFGWIKQLEASAHFTAVQVQVVSDEMCLKYSPRNPLGQARLVVFTRMETDNQRRQV